ncbi:hypothetical protein F5H01DRAFT_144209 [Linnemannia elongata]|nr:hypothetical protein F5H01DRAFT_144209 [Linnemannia elongata]
MASKVARRLIYSMITNLSTACPELTLCSPLCPHSVGPKVGLADTNVNTDNHKLQKHSLLLLLMMPRSITRNAAKNSNNNQHQPTLIFCCEPRSSSLSGGYFGLTLNTHSLYGP